jgi:hypothetical protein
MTEDSESKQSESEAEFNDSSKTEPPKTPDDSVKSGFQTLLEASEILSLREIVQKPPILSAVKDNLKETKHINYYHKMKTIFST